MGNLIKNLKEDINWVIEFNKKLAELEIILRPITERNEVMVKLTKKNASIYKRILREQYVILVSNRVRAGLDFYFALAQAHRDINELMNRKNNGSRN